MADRKKHIARNTFIIVLPLTIAMLIFHSRIEAYITEKMAILPVCTSDTTKLAFVEKYCALPDHGASRIMTYVLIVLGILTLLTSLKLGLSWHKHRNRS